MEPATAERHKIIDNIIKKKTRRRALVIRLFLVFLFLYVSLVLYMHRTNKAEMQYEINRLQMENEHLKRKLDLFLRKRSFDTFKVPEIVPLRILDDDNLG